MPIFLLSSLWVEGQSRIKVPVKIKVEDGGMEGVSVVLRNNSTGESQQISGDAKLDLELNIGSDYIISFSKQGYITKKIAFNTKVPDVRQAQGFYPFNFEVVLFPQYEGVNIVVFNQPVGKIFFDRLLDDFGYDTDYTKQIQSELKKAEDEIIQKQQEQHELAQQQKKEDDRRKAEEEKIAKEQAKVRESERKKAEEEARKAAILEAKRLKAEQDSLRAVSRMNSGNANAGRATPVNGSDNRNQAPGIDDGDGRSSSRSTQGDDSNGHHLSSGSGQDSGQHPMTAVGTDAGRNAMASGGGLDGKENSIAGKTSGNDVRKSAAEQRDGSDNRSVKAPASPVDANAQIESSEYEENGKKILKVVVRNGITETVFLRVIFRWGDVVYYKSNKYITGAYFFSQTGFR